jgi:hypothetical protein
MEAILELQISNSNTLSLFYVTVYFHVFLSQTPLILTKFIEKIYNVKLISLNFL